MQFNSYPFLFVFLPIAVGGFWLFERFFDKSSARNWLTLSSVAFYLYATPASLIAILPTISVNYLIARRIQALDETRIHSRSVALAVGVLFDVLALAYFKYSVFLVDELNTISGLHLAERTAFLPLGFSFLTFQSISFLIDVSAGRARLIGLRDFALFSLFFPRSIAGPIILYGEVMPQLERERSRVKEDLAVGICLLFTGLFKKAVIADGLAPLVNATFNMTSPEPTLIASWTGALAYTLQLYFDFSGYSDMATGTARFFGVRFPINFNSPLKARSMIDFWSRWHITLTRFLTLYIYTPLVLHFTRARIGSGKSIINGSHTTGSAFFQLVAFPTIITMAVSGLWHGASWSYITVGLLYGCYLTINQMWRIFFRPQLVIYRSYESLMRPIGWVLTFGAVMLASIVLRAPSILSALSILRGMSGANGVLSPDVQFLHALLGSDLTLPSTLSRWQPINSLLWLGALLLAALILPNVFQLLHKLEPVLEYSNLADQKLIDMRKPGGIPTKMISPLIYYFRNISPSKWTFVLQDQRRFYIRPLVGAVIALVTVLGLISLGNGETFIYGAF